MIARTRLRSERGFTLTELLISTAIMLVVTGAIFSLMNPAQGTAQTQPEVADMQQRMRVSTDALFKDLVMAGAGPYQGAVTGSLINFFAPILPRRTGQLNPDPTQGAASYKTDVITLSYIPNEYTQTTIRQAMPANSVELKVNAQPNCPKQDPLCGFKNGMSVILFDSSGSFENFTVTQTQSDAAHLQHRGQNWSHEYGAGSAVTQIVSHTYYLDRTTDQLMRYDGGSTDIPLVDNVVDLQFSYYGDPAAPTLPRPPAGVANCLYDVDGNYIGPGALTPTDGSLALLTADILTDGPYCGSSSNQFDADLLRIRKVLVSLRVQAAAATLRGTDTSLFMKPGTALGGERFVPDYRLSFEVAPRNLNLAR